ncbi:SET domain-containing protein [Podospora fimiseda]|uniref:SET domain-containing protein n=1 Tax=Podospora fimiseda TaxID=252190 RepID=A0AAN7BS08_9PEZI|nr:SET domain-containing protein [Podospora fimiseda]
MSEPATFVPLPVHEGWDSAVQDGAAAAPQPVQEQAALEPAPKPTRRRNPYEQYYEIRPSQTGGLGCFAVRDIDEGVVILMEKPMLDTTVYNLRRDLATLPKAVNAHFYTLAHDASVDRFAKVEDIWHKNAFEVPSGIAIFAIASRFNHACEPVFNVVYAWDRFKNVMTFCTKRAVKAGEELRITYGGCPLSLYVRYGFICQCGGCDSVSRAQAEEHRPYIWR